MRPLAPLSIPFKPSRRLLLIQMVAHIVAIGAVFAATLPLWLATVLLLLIGVSMSLARRGPCAGRLILDADGRLEIVGADDTANTVEVHPQTLVLSFLVVLVYRQAGRLRSLTLLGDSLATEEDFRWLRLWLRWRSNAARAA